MCGYSCIGFINFMLKGNIFYKTLVIFINCGKFGSKCKKYLKKKDQLKY